jgi:hypothetical protein
MKKFSAFIFLLLASSYLLHSEEILFPENHLEIRRPIPYETMVSFLDHVNSLEHVTVTREGQSLENRGIFLVRIGQNHEQISWRVFLYGAQHGDEPAGKDALLYLIRHFAENSEALPMGVELWIMPMVNPDGVARDQRRNGHDADLNRDHTLLAQPETRALHRIFREIMPHVAVDCHEFRRDSEGYDQRGWLEWPEIMMDTANHPLFDDAVYRAGLRWLDHIGEVLGAAGYNFSRYVVGDAPPEGELRHSTLDTDDGRNGLGAYGGLSFIIESGVQRGAEDSNTDLGRRVDAYLRIFHELIFFDKFREKDLEFIARARTETRLPKFLPINSFWGNVGQVITPVKVIEKGSNRTLQIETANFMHARIVKKSVSTPQSYAVPAVFADSYSRLLHRHAIPYLELDEARNFTVEPCYLQSVSEEYDDVYNRYSGLQIVTKKEPQTVELGAGSLLVPLNGPAALRAALLLEPTQLYGLYQFDQFRELVDDDGRMPVLRVVGTGPR